MNQILDIDTKDQKIIELLLEDSTSSVQTIANEVGLTNNPCWRRIKRLQDCGLIKKYTIELNRKLLGLGTTAFVALKIEKHDTNWLCLFARAIQEMPEVLECHRMTGSVDYMLKIAVKDLEHYDHVYQTLIAKVDGLLEVSSTFSMEEIKSTP